MIDRLEAEIHQKSLQYEQRIEDSNNEFAQRLGNHIKRQEEISQLYKETLHQLQHTEV
jgi:hypothetical protein